MYNCSCLCMSCTNQLTWSLSCIADNFHFYDRQTQLQYNWVQLKIASPLSVLHLYVRKRRSTSQTKSRWRPSTIRLRPSSDMSSRFHLISSLLPRERERKSDNTAPLFEFRILDQHLATQPKWLDLPSQLNRVNVGTTQWNLSSQRLCTVSQIDRLTPCHLVGGWSHPSGGVDRMPESQHLSSSLSSSYW